MQALQFEDVQVILQAPDTEHATVLVNLTRLKQAGPKKKNENSSFLITHSGWVKLIELYIDCTPKEERTSRFLRKVVKDRKTNSIKITKAVLGKNTIAKFPQDIATYLNLPDPKGYTGHCYRRTGATILADEGADTLQLKRAGGWKSDTVAQGYVDNSRPQKERTAAMFAAGSRALTTTPSPGAMQQAFSSSSSSTVSSSSSSSKNNVFFQTSDVNQSVSMNVDISGSTNANIQIFIPESFAKHNKMNKRKSTGGDDER